MAKREATCGRLAGWGVLAAHDAESSGTSCLPEAVVLKPFPISRIIGSVSSTGQQHCRRRRSFAVLSEGLAEKATGSKSTCHDDSVEPAHDPSSASSVCLHLSGHVLAGGQPHSMMRRAARLVGGRRGFAKAAGAHSKPEQVRRVYSSAMHAFPVFACELIRHFMTHGGRIRARESWWLAAGAWATSARRRSWAAGVRRWQGWWSLTLRGPPRSR